MINHKSDSIKALNEQEQQAQQTAEQADTIELLKGCIMELADLLLGEGGLE